MNQTKSETQVPTTIPGLTPTTESAVGIGGVFALIVSFILHYRRKASRDGTEIIKDRTEGKLIETLMVERDTSRTSEREAWTKVNELSVANARLESTNQYQREEIARLKQLVEQLQLQFDEVKTRLQKLSNGATGHTRPGPL